jgi:MFS transporter, SP family, general alpha glucoside:H+ symporter
MPYFGRRPVYLVGMAVMCATLMTIGIMNVWTTNRAVALGQASLTLFWTFAFQLSVGQLGWALPAEMGSTRLRQKTVCLARNAYYIVSVISGVLEPYFINPTAWNLRGYTGFIWGGTALCTLVWAYFRLPETMGRTFSELDILFAQKISARKFKLTEVREFDENVTAPLAARYSVADPEKRPSVIPSVSVALAKMTGRDEALTSQRRESLASGGADRRSSIAPAVTEYLKHGGRGD